MRPGSLQSLSRPGPDARVGLSLSCNESRFHGFHSRVKAPALTLRFLASRFHDPFGPSLHHRTQVAPGIGSINAYGPLPLPLPALPTASPTSTPLRDYCVPRDQSVLPVCCKLARLPNPPDSRSLPAPASITRRRRRSTFPVRYVSGPLVLLSLQFSAFAYSCFTPSGIWGFLKCFYLTVYYI
jgi:hypothetical protein